ncbi:MAG: ABC transporter permease subunit [Pirellula sp.]
MRPHSRATASGHTLLAQGEPLVWLTGGMFAIACSMIAVLLGFIVFQGLRTHWQRSVGFYALNDGSILGGELLNSQPYSVDQQSLSALDATSLANATRLLSGREQATSEQLYVRTGNYDVGNQHFAFIPRITLASNVPYIPRELWLLERREWGVLYGFPRRLAAAFSPEQDEEYRVLTVLAQQLDQLAATLDSEKSESLKKSIAEHISQRASTLQEAFAKVDPSTDDKTQIMTVIRRSINDMRDHGRQLQSAKAMLGRMDRNLSVCRLSIRKAELADKSDLQSIADEVIENASMQGTIEAQTEEIARSITAWENILRSDATAVGSLKSISEALRQQTSETMQSFAEAGLTIQKRIDALPARSKLALEYAMAHTLETTKQQFLINHQIVRLEEIIKSQSVEMQLPITESTGAVSVDRVKLRTDTAKIDPMLADALSLDKEVATQGEYAAVQLSDSHMLLSISATGKLGDHFVAVSDSSLEQASIQKLTNKTVLVSDIVRITEPNNLEFLGKLRLYLDRWIEFLFGEPREAGIEGGFFPAIWGTIVMTLIMSVAVMPFGVMAALYMKEYAKSGWVLSLIRISINNLAGVPSIVYGVFGLAFFCYTIGGYIDGGPAKAGFETWPTGVWFVALGMTAISGTIAFFLAFLGSGSPAHMSKARKRVASFSGLFWLASLLLLIAIIAKSPFFHGFYEASLPNPTFGKGCLLWASLTLALLTLPVVIVATEEALAAVPNSLREGSYACGAGKWQTLQRIVLPYARPGIITGFILAMARGAGEVAPMMLVGAIPLATDLPLDLEFPFFHGSRSFMHLGFQIYSLGFQSQNSEAAKPMVFTATLLLLTIVTLLNVTAIWLRARLRKRFQGSQF